MLDRTRFKAIMTEAGKMAMDQWHDAGKTLKVWDKSPNNPVSAADIAVDRFLRPALAELLPAAGWLSEETVDVPDQRDGSLAWLVDPIDGTRDFIAGRRGWAVSVALVCAGRPLIGALYAPARALSESDTGEYWYAEAGQGAWLNDVRLMASRATRLPGARVPAQQLSIEDGDLIMVDQPNSIALRIAMVAANRADIVATLRWGYEWDIAAACLIAREAGAAVSDAFGQKLNYNKPDPRAFGVLVSAPAIHGAAVDRLAERAKRLG